MQRAVRVLAPGLRDAPCAAVRHYSQVLLLVLYGIEARPTRSVLRCARGVRGKRGVSVTISVGAIVNSNKGGLAGP